MPASTIRAVRLFHRKSLESMAEMFGISVRTVHRWEERGVDPRNVPRDPQARVPDWRAKLLIWMVRRYELTGVTDNRKKQGESGVPPPQS